MIFNLVGGGGGGREYYSIIKITTNDSELVGENIVVTAIGEEAEVETYTKTLSESKSLEFKVRQLTQYRITCTTITRYVTIPHYADYSTELSLREYIYKNGVEAEGLIIESSGNHGGKITREETYINVTRSSGSGSGWYNIVKQFKLVSGEYSNLVIKGEVMQTSQVTTGAAPLIRSFAAVTVNRATAYNSAITYKSDNIPNVLGEFTVTFPLTGISGDMYCGLIGQNYYAEYRQEIFHVTEIYLE